MKAKTAQAKQIFLEVYGVNVDGAIASLYVLALMQNLIVLEVVQEGRRNKL